MNIIGYHISDVIANSNGEICSEPPYLEWLLKQGNKDTIQVFYHMDYDIANLIRLLDLTEPEGQKLLKQGKFSIQGLSGTYLMTYYPGKFFSIDKGSGSRHSFAMFSNMSQYTDIRFVSEPHRDMAVGRALRARNLGLDVYEALTSIGLSPKTLTSPIAAYKKEVLDNMDICTVDDIPEQVGEYAYMCAKGAWLEAFKRGKWDKTFDYDLSSAYAFQLMSLPDLRLGKWIHSSTTLNPDKTLGFFKGRVTMTAPFHPIIYKAKQVGSNPPMSYTPIGSWDTYITGDEWEFIEKYKLGTFEMESGWWWIPSPATVKYSTMYPFDDIITTLHKQKESNGAMKKKIIKRIMAGLYGLTLQIFQHEDNPMGDYFNSVYGALVETRARLEVARFCLKAIENKIDVICVIVDGVLLAAEMPQKALEELKQ